MNRNTNHILKSLKQSTFFWTFALFSYAIFRFFGFEQEVASITEANIQTQSFRIPLFVLTITGFSLGILYGIIDFLYEKYLLKKYSLGVGLLLQTFLHFTSTILVFNIIITFFSNFLPMNFKLEIGWWLTDKRFWSIIWYIVLASIVFSFIKIAIERFGRGVFIKMLMGHYKNPQEEERIFMFLDLKDSTTIAEKLGYHKYSQFIQDCFIDLNEVVLDYSAEIYQYVGDEAVLSWTYKKGLENNNCIGVFFAFEEKRQARKAYYEAKYGVFPEFKAGLHGGKLMAAEVGFVKKELAYHGDVINTSARIQAQCNKYNVTLLISEKLLKDLHINIQSTANFLGNILLKGKQKEVKIHSITSLS
jgi:adenylate cyclase